MKRSYRLFREDKINDHLRGKQALRDELVRHHEDALRGELPIIEDSGHELMRSLRSRDILKGRQIRHAKRKINEKIVDLLEEREIVDEVGLQ